jgi:hypothetical protein
MSGLIRRGRGWLLAMSMGGAFVLGGCDPAVRDTVLSGVQSASTGLVTTFIAAFFESLAAEEEEAATTV